MNFFSQQGEDLFIFLNYINQYCPDGVFLELGAVDGVIYSNSLFFELHLGFNGVLIEPQQHYFSSLSKSRNNNKNILVNKAISQDKNKIEFIGKNPAAGVKSLMNKNHLDYFHKYSPTYFVETETLDSILTQNGVKYIDLFFLDVEGGEYDVLKTLNFKNTEIYLICIELDGNNKEKDENCRQILIDNGFIFKNKMFINEFWVNENYSKKSRLFKQQNEISFSGMNNQKISNLGTHRFTENHLINGINEYISNSH
jgi:FkbM family methyltransferase